VNSAGSVQAGLERALASLQSGDPAGAFAALEAVLRLDPDNFDALNLSGVAATRLGRHEDAVALLERALALQPEHAGAHNNLGLVLRLLGRTEEAVVAYRRTTELAPGYAAAHANLGNAYAALSKHRLAIASFEASLALRPDHADTLVQYARALCRLNRTRAALDALDHAVALAPEHVEALVARGDCLRDLKRFEESLADHQKALQLAPDHQLLPGSVLRRQMKLCEWGNFDALVAKLATRIGRGEMAIRPFSSLQIFDDPYLQLTVARTMSFDALISPVAPALRRAGGKLHVAYFSADFRAHATMYVMAELFALHDRERFRISAFAFNVGEDDEYTRRTRRLVDEYVELDGLSSPEAAALSRERGVDIAVDVKGYTQHSRPGIFAHRAAPLQVNYLAYPGTMGGGQMDYIVADRVLIPSGTFDAYSEKVVWLPGCYFPRDTSMPRPSARPARRAHGLPEDAVVFCSFNQSNKILPDTFTDWMRILAGVEGSVLWLYADNPGACANLRKEAAARGIDPARLVFGASLPQREHMERLQLADLCLDTLPYNAHTTANDSLYVGVPILTLPGRTFAGRVCASMLTTLGLPELIASDREDFVRLGIELGSNRDKLVEVAAKLATNARTSPLYDMPRYVHGLEQAYERMAERHIGGLPPDHLAIAP